MKDKLKGIILLLATAFIWGSSFVAQKTGMDDIGPITFMCMRSLVGAVALFPVAIIYEKASKKSGKQFIHGKQLVVGGVICGIAYLLASLFQQFGLVTTTAGKSAFVTALYIVIAPLLGVFLGQKVLPKAWRCIIIAAVGMFLLCVSSTFSLAIGDLLTLICAFFFSVHIIVIDKYAPVSNCCMLSCIQFLASGIISGILMLIFEKPSLSAISAAIIPILYVGILSNAVAYTLQMFGQKYLDVSSATLIMSLESVFAALSGWIVLHETMSFVEITGCVLIAFAIVYAQVGKAPVEKSSKSAGASEEQIKTE